MLNNKDISSDERAKYKAKIARKESDLDNLKKQRNSFEQSDISFSNTLNSAYGALRELQERDRQWDSTTDKQITMDSQKASEAMKTIRKQNARVEQYFNEVKKETLNNIEDLEKERRELPWD